MQKRFNQEQENSLIMNYISDGLIIPTGSIMELWEKHIKKWLMMSSTGAIIYSRPRVGKTVAIDYITEKIKILYNEHVPVIRWNITNHAVTERNFYSSLLMAIGIPEPKKSVTALTLKVMVINLLTALAFGEQPDTGRFEDYVPALRRVVLFCDEAYLLDIKDFNWLMDLYNNLRQNKVHLTTFLVGSYELKDLKSYMISCKKDQIIGRFMIDEHEFSGIRTKEELALCLSTFDSEMKIPGIFEPVIPSQRFFPDAYANAEGYYYLLTDMFWEVFQRMREIKKIQYADIPMKYFIRSIILTMMIFGKGGVKESYFLDSVSITEAVEESGYSMSGGSNNGHSYKNAGRKAKS